MFTYLFVTSVALFPAERDVCVCACVRACVRVSVGWPTVSVDVKQHSTKAFLRSTGREFQTLGTKIV